MQKNEDTPTNVNDPARRDFFKSLGKMSLGAATGAVLLSNGSPLHAQSAAMQDTANQILQAAVIAEDLATVFYYNGLVGGVIQDPALAGPGGTALVPSAMANIPNVDYLRAAMGQEVAHANLLRAVGNFGADATIDPYQTFYFPAGTFDTLSAFTGVLEALESAFIGAYLNAIREFAGLASQTSSTVPDGAYGGPYSAAQLQYFAQVAASIMGVEAEHRVLGGVINNLTQPNNLYYEQTDGLQSVYNGPNSAVVALTPFLTATTGPAYSLATALAAAATISIPSTGSQPAYQPVSFTASPNPVPLAAGAVDGVTTITWSAPSATTIEIHVGSPDGPLFTHNVSSGSMATGLWVTNGITFYLQDVSTGQALTSAYTLATLIVNTTAV